MASNGSAEDALVRLRIFQGETGASLASLSRGCGLHGNSLNRLHDPSWRPRMDTLTKISDFLDQVETATPVAELKLDGAGWKVVHDADGWYLVLDDGKHVSAKGPFGKVREAIDAAPKGK